MEANGRLQLQRFYGGNGGKRQAATATLWSKQQMPVARVRDRNSTNNRGLWRQTAGCNALTTITTNACGRSAWCKQPRGIRSVLAVLGVLRLANGRLERPNIEGYGGNGGKRQAATLWSCGQSAWSKFHTCGGPRHRPCLGEGRGRRTHATHGYNHDNDDYLGKYI